jgi:hypothetical protein
MHFSGWTFGCLVSLALRLTVSWHVVSFQWTKVIHGLGACIDDPRGEERGREASDEGDCSSPLAPVRVLVMFQRMYLVVIYLLRARA